MILRPIYFITINGVYLNIFKFLQIYIVRITLRLDCNFLLKIRLEKVVHISKEIEKDSIASLENLFRF